MKIARALFLTLSFAACLTLSPTVSAQSPAQTPQPQPPAFEQKLREARYDLRIENGKFAGSAAPVLEDAIANAQ